MMNDHGFIKIRPQVQKWYDCDDENGWAILYHNMQVNFAWAGCNIVPIGLWSAWMDGNHTHALDGKGAIS